MSYSELLYKLLQKSFLFFPVQVAAGLDYGRDILLYSEFAENRSFLREG